MSISISLCNAPLASFKIMHCLISFGVSFVSTRSQVIGKENRAEYAVTMHISDQVAFEEVRSALLELDEVEEARLISSAKGMRFE